VPNIMVNGVSIGGSDDLAEMDAKKLLVDKIKGLGAKKVDIKERFVKGESTPAPEGKGHESKGHGKSHGSSGHNHDES
jgi:hypothetical protein